MPRLKTLPHHTLLFFSFPISNLCFLHSLVTFRTLSCLSMCVSDVFLQQFKPGELQFIQRRELAGAQTIPSFHLLRPNLLHFHHPLRILRHLPPSWQRRFVFPGNANFFPPRKLHLHGTHIYLCFDWVLVL